jgi:hypothetical protein
MEYKRVMEFEWTSDDGNVRIQIYKDNFFPDGGIMIQVGDRWIRHRPERLLEWAYDSLDRSAFPFRIGRLVISSPYIIEHEGYKPLFWRFHWKLKS